MTKADNHDWILLHRVRFASPVDGTGRPFPGPETARAWRFYPSSPPGPNGLRTNVSDEWGGFGLYRAKADAEEVFDAPEEHLPFLEDTVEAFHALAVPFAHRGEVNWRGEVRENDTFTVSPSDPGGPLVALTSAGFNNSGPDELPRIVNFLRRVDLVQDFYATLPGNIRRGVFSGNAVDGHDGVTVSLWRDDAAMIQGAYKPGQHRSEMDYNRETPLFDRSSFSRLRIMGRKGTWDGSDPVLEMAGEAAVGPA